MKSNGYDITISKELADYAATVGFDPVFGARPLRRVIQNEIADPLSQMLLSGKVVTGKNYELQLDANKHLIVKEK